MNICVVGTGYVGLVTGAVFADLGNDVVCVDKVRAKIDSLQAGRMPIYEPGLEEMVARNVADGRLTFTVDLAAGVRQAEVIFIAVGTPARATARPTSRTWRRWRPRSAGPWTATRSWSTSPPSRWAPASWCARWWRGISRAPIEFDVVSNPEFLREGSAIEDTLRPDRIVIGASNQHAAKRLVELYAPLERPMIITDLPSAEVIKYASNSFLAAKISFINAIANVCEAVGADVTQVMKGMGLDSRIGAAFLQAGLGYGGSCFPKDVDSLIHTAGRLGYDFRMLKSVADINRERAARLVETIRKVLSRLDDKTVAVLGLSFKPNTDDMREAKSVEVIEQLHAAGATIRAYDPVATGNARAPAPGVTYSASPYEAAQDADAVVLVTEWNEFKFINLERLRRVLRRRVIFDGRNIWEPDRMRRLGFEYYSIGRKPVIPA